MNKVFEGKEYSSEKRKKIRDRLAIKANERYEQRSLGAVSPTGSDVPVQAIQLRNKETSQPRPIERDIGLFKTKDQVFKVTNKKPQKPTNFKTLFKVVQKPESTDSVKVYKFK